MKRKIKRTVSKSSVRSRKKTSSKLAVAESLKPNPRKKQAKRQIRRARPIHKRVLLHPVSVLILLCVGVLIVGLTIHSVADSYSITATVEASPPSSPATITYPADQTHFTTTPINVSGICSPNTYVELYRNGNFSGVTNCGAGVTTYSISIGLSLGSNDLYTKIFSVTNNEGPDSAHITIFYDLPPTPSTSPSSPSTPIVPPVVPNSGAGLLEVISQDNQIYKAGVTALVSPYPIISGVAPPYSKVTITFQPNAITCITYAGANGAWSCGLDQPLTDGLHTVSVSALTPSGSVLHFPSYYIRVSSSVRPLHSVGGPLRLFLINSSYQYQVYSYGQSVNLNLSLSGGVSPYAVSILWGDGSQSIVAQKDQSAFVVSHTYKPLGSGLKYYTIKIQAVDNDDATAFLQMTAVVRGQQISGPLSLCNTSAQAANNSCTPASPSFLSRIKQWVWVVWPAYAVVILMVSSFWLGERQELLMLLNKKQPKPKRRYHRI